MPAPKTSNQTKFAHGLSSKVTGMKSAADTVVLPHFRLELGPVAHYIRKSDLTILTVRWLHWRRTSRAGWYSRAFWRSRARGTSGRHTLTGAKAPALQIART